MKKNLVITLLVFAIAVALISFFRNKQNSGTARSVEKQNADLAAETPIQPDSTNHASVATAKPVVSQDLGNVPASIRLIVDLQRSPLERQQATRALKRNLDHDEITALVSFLQGANDEDHGQTGQVIKSDLMDALVAQANPSEAFSEVLAAISRDTAQDDVIRDYAVQHLSMLSQRLTEPNPWTVEKIAAVQQTLQDTLWEIAEKSDESMAGTALLGLWELTEQDDRIERKRVADAALKIAASDAANALARISALQICARLEVRAALPLAVHVAQANGAPALRLSAIGALGTIGGEPEIAILEKIAAGDNELLASVAASATKKIRQRLGKG